VLRLLNRLTGLPIKSTEPTTCPSARASIKLASCDLRAERAWRWALGRRGAAARAHLVHLRHDLLDVAPAEDLAELGRRGGQVPQLEGVEGQRDALQVAGCAVAHKTRSISPAPKTMNGYVRAPAPTWMLPIAMLRMSKSTRYARMLRAASS